VDYLGGTITDTSKPLPGRRHEYAYDTIGNRTSSGRNGVAGTEEDYTSNSLNQVVTRENHAVQFSGTAAPDALVKVAGRPVLAGRQGAYWYDETTVPNTSGPYRGPRYAMARPAGQNIVRIDGRIVTLAEALQSFTYDLDGNLTHDGIWTYTWDAEGRLVAMATTPTAVAAGFVEQTLRFVYDHLGRRVRKEVFGEGSALVSRTIWIYDGWNMIAEYDQPAIGGSLALKRSYAWGLDLLGSFRASGGVGALLQLRDYSENATYLAGYDGNGNLTTLQNAATGTLAATYEYGPYGEPIATSGAYADKNPLRFSTKYTDDETGLVSFGRRYYDPRNGRFLGRDPIEERGGRNLYGFVGNEPINHGDRLGMETFLTWVPYFDDFGNPIGSRMTEDDYYFPGFGGGFLGQAFYGLLGLDALFAGSRMPVYGTPTPYIPPPPQPEPKSILSFILETVATADDSERRLGIDSDSVSVAEDGAILIGTGLRVTDIEGSAAEVFTMLATMAQHSETFAFALRRLASRSRGTTTIRGLKGRHFSEALGGDVRDNDALLVFVMDFVADNPRGETNYPALSLAHEIGHLFDTSTLYTSSKRYPLTDADLALGGGLGGAHDPALEAFAVAFANQVAAEILAATGVSIGSVRRYYEGVSGSRAGPNLPPLPSSLPDPRL